MITAETLEKLEERHIRKGQPMSELLADYMLAILDNDLPRIHRIGGMPDSLGIYM
jgi:hypothetical protein